MIQILLVILLLLMNGFFVAAEFALVRVRVSQLEVLKEQGNKAAARVLKIVHQIDSYLSAVQLGVTIASLGIGALAEPAINRWFMAFLDWLNLDIDHDVSHTISYIIAFTLASFAHIVCGELAPKSIAIAKPLEVSMFVSMPMRIFHAVFSPIMYLLVATSNLLLKLVHIEPVQGDHSSGVSAEELRNIAHHSQDDGTITKEQGSLIENVFQFSALSAREIMIPRGKIDAIAIDTPIDEFLNTALSLGHSRYPVYRTDVDDIAGIIHIKDVFAARQANKETSLESLMREVVYIPETATIGHVLEKLQQKRSHLAIVVDEYGGTSGILTLEDALERLVGDIEDEFDPEQQNDIEPQDGGWTVRGETLLSELSETLDSKEIDAESDTVSGFIMERLGRVAKPHDTVEFQDLKYEVTSMERLRISRVFIKKVQKD
ncbi:MAG: HlyC/CorC family transporter [Proteobacteria bacterium]|nr:HlyC/CorC family transporter [Pseudomonadota bacterium]MBQ4360385.1 HlyC/CorC family transporter [Pseudomonadota bacterium]